MATPESMTTLNLTGTFVLVSDLLIGMVYSVLRLSQNKKFSDNDAMDKILSAQNVGWVTRKAIASATITLKINHAKDGSGVEALDIEQIPSGPFGGSTEKRLLDWHGQTRRVAYQDITEGWLKEGWTEDTKQHGLIEALARADPVKSKTSWETRIVGTCPA
jgi:hypothetical protein